LEGLSQGQLDSIEEDQSPPIQDIKTSMLRLACFAKSSREFIVDSGASFHLISPCTLSAEERKTIRPLKAVIHLFTAAGGLLSMALRRLVFEFTN